MLHLILGGAALQRCGNYIVLNAALQAAEKFGGAGKGTRVSTGRWDM
jgi:hypothetical protein